MLKLNQLLPDLKASKTAVWVLETFTLRNTGQKSHWQKVTADSWFTVDFKGCYISWSPFTKQDSSKRTFFWMKFFKWNQSLVQSDSSFCFY